ncbi:Tn7-like element transposition protein TnsE [Kistimonas scapharcae]|uniref:Tn7-like element transposition protein TnsE n=1 Tax=Kistimonas scapharcae TaxID=1036133 RepID=UPI0031ED94A0
MLVEGCTYDNKKRFSSENRQSRQVRFEGYKGKIKDQTGKVVFVYDCGGCRVAIPAIELARTLYLHNTHLTRTALRPNGLQGLATTEQDQNTSTITFNRLSDFSVSSLQSRSAQAHLIWLLFDERARKGFSSIYESLLLCGRSEWSFDFEPPCLDGWVAKVAGPVGDQVEDIFYTQEITALHNPSFFYQNKVLIFHPNLKKVVCVDPKDKRRPVVDKPDQDPLLDLQSIPKLGGKRDIVSEAGFSFTFGNEIPSQLVPEKQENKLSPAVTSGAKNTAERTGVGHAGKEGTSQELDFGINRSEEDPQGDLKSAEGASRFQLFQEVITQLIELEGYQHIAIKCYELPKPITHRSAYINKDTGKPRVFHVAYIRYLGLPLLIVEVDMDDYAPKKTLSTRVFGFNSDPLKSFRAIMQGCSDNGVRWDTKIINQHCGVSDFAKHPQRETSVEGVKQARTPSEYKDAWVAALDRAVTRTRQQVNNTEEVTSQL